MGSNLGGRNFELHLEKGFLLIIRAGIISAVKH